jgi:hypothetical protein
MTVPDELPVVRGRRGSAPATNVFLPTGSYLRSTSQASKLRQVVDTVAVDKRDPDQTCPPQQNLIGTTAVRVAELLRQPRQL